MHPTNFHRLVAEIYSFLRSLLLSHHYYHHESSSLNQQFEYPQLPSRRKILSPLIAKVITVIKFQQARAFPIAKFRKRPLIT